VVTLNDHDRRLELRQTNWNNLPSGISLPTAPPFSSSLVWADTANDKFRRLQTVVVMKQLSPCVDVHMVVVDGNAVETSATMSSRQLSIHYCNS
jgi:hypothetical protein